ncbi:MAG TPA: hypothetical protein PKK12_11280, partial [Candidatus Aminicenantes bacterium]|nr:hypothetical protein [Candidatus Aminicenantes bacterium]
ATSQTAALAQLNAALNSIRDPMLLGTINAEVGRIKQNNPILGLLPKFREGSNNPKLHRISVQILKKILTPADCPVLLPYLNAADAMIAEGAFEILCETAEATAHSFLFGYFENRTGQAVDNDTFFSLLQKLEHFLIRNPELIEPRFPWIKDWMRKDDARTLEIGISILSASPARAPQEHLKQLYRERPELHVKIGEKIARSRTGAEFLTGEFKADPAGQLELIPLLLTSEAGSQYLGEALDSLPNDVRTHVLDAIPAERYLHFRPHFHQALLKGDFPQQKAALEKIRRFNDFQARELLFDPQNSDKWPRLAEEYLATIGELFPVRTLAMLCNRPLSDLIPAQKFRGFLELAQRIVDREPLLQSLDKEIFQNLFSALLGQGSRHVNLFLLTLLRKMKTLESSVYWSMQSAGKIYNEKRGDNLAPEEKIELKKIREEFNSIAHEINHLNEGTKRITQFLSQTPPDFDTLAEIMVSTPQALVLNRLEIRGLLHNTLLGDDPAQVTVALQFLARNPGIASFFAAEIAALPETMAGKAMIALRDIRQHLPPPPRFILRLSDLSWRNAVMDQLLSLFPEIEIGELHVPRVGDFLLADPPGLKQELGG